MRAAFDYLAAFQHQDLIRTANRRKAVSNNESGAAPTQRLQSILDQRFALTVEARRSLVKNQDFRLGKNCASNRHALALSARQLHAALADDGVITIGKTVDKLLAMSNAAGFDDLFARGVRVSEANVLRDSAVKQEVILEYHAELTAIVFQTNPGKVATIHVYVALQRTIKGHHQTNQRATPG